MHPSPEESGTATGRPALRMLIASGLLLTLVALTIVGISRLHRHTPTAGVSPSPSSSSANSPSGSHSPPSSSCGQRFAPAEAPDIPRVVSERPPGTVFCFEAGIYRMTETIVPKDGDRFLGAGVAPPSGTTLTGTEPIANWVRSGNLFAHIGDVVSLPLGGRCRAGTACQHPDQLFRNGLPLRRVLAPCSASKVGTGTFCVDYTSRRMYMGDSPAGARMEYAHVQQAFDGGSGVIIESMAVNGFASTANRGAVVRAGTDWLVDGIDMKNNHGCAIAMIGTSGTVVENSRFHDNGQLGFCGTATGARFVNNEVDHNNLAGFDAAWGAGGGKLTESVNITIESNNIHDNNGNGIWFDIDSTGALIRANRVTDNTKRYGAGNGITYEISCRAAIYGNTLAGNAMGGILISNSHHVRIGSPGAGNTISENLGSGIRMIARTRVGVQPHCGNERVVSEVVVADNDITMPVGASWNGVLRLGATPVSRIRFMANRYHMPRAIDCLSPRWVWWNGVAPYRLPFSGTGITWQGSLRQDLPPEGHCGT